MFKIGSYIINESAIVTVNLNAKKSNTKEEIRGVKIYFLTPNHTDYVGGQCGTVPDCLFFSGAEAEAIRKYYQFLNTLNLTAL